MQAVIEGELVASKTSTYHDLLVPNSAPNSNIDDNDSTPPIESTPTTSSQIVEPLSTAHDPVPSTSSISPMQPLLDITIHSPSSSPLSSPALQPAPSSSTHPPAPSISVSLSPPIRPPDRPPPAAKPSQHGHGPAKVYQKSRSLQRIEARNKPPPDPTKTNDGSDEPKLSDKGSDDKNDEAQVRDELEPKLSELTWTPAFLATGEDPESYAEVIGLVDRNEWQAAMQAKMDMIVSVGMFELVPPPRDCKPIGCKWVFCVK
jgi:hypothetical protein